MVAVPISYFINPVKTSKNLISFEYEGDHFIHQRVVL